jgi:hypothetical protein
MRMRFLAIVFLFAIATPAAGQEVDDLPSARRHFRNGTKLFDLGRFEEAAHEYEAAFQAHDDPFLLFNCAQAYRHAKNYPMALQFFHTYLRRLPKAPNRPEVEERIVELQKIIEH